MLFQKYMGVEISRDNLRLDPKSLFQLAIVVFVAILLWNPFFQMVDSLITEEMSFTDQLALGGFKSGFILMPIQLGLLTLFSPIDYPFFRYIRIVLPGLFIGVVLIFVLISMRNTLSDIPGFDGAFGLFYALYPFIMSFVLRMAVTHDMKNRVDRKSVV